MTMKWLCLALVLALGCSSIDKVIPSSTAERQYEIDRLNSLLESKDKEIAELKEEQKFYKNMDEDKDQRIKILRATIFDQDLNMDVGLRLYRETNKSNNQYRRDNARFEKENDILRIALEKRGVFYDDALEEIADPTLTPLGLERAKNENTKKQLELERSKVGALEADYNRRIALFTRNEDTLRARNLKLEQELNKLRRTNPDDR